MNKTFLDYVAELPNLMEKLKKSEIRTRDNLHCTPRKGIYVFYEDAKPLYVGRSNNIKTRIQYHCRPSSGHGSATFAFILAKENAKANGININMERGQLENDPRFKKEFNMAKDRVSKMLIRVIDIDNQIIQSLFDVYASIELKTKYNDFSTH
jgi:hypothetical protein